MPRTAFNNLHETLELILKQNLNICILYILSDAIIYLTVHVKIPGFIQDSHLSHINSVYKSSKFCLFDNSLLHLLILILIVTSLVWIIIIS